MKKGVKKGSRKEERAATCARMKKNNMSSDPRIKPTMKLAMSPNSSATKSLFSFIFSTSIIGLTPHDSKRYNQLIHFCRNPQAELVDFCAPGY
jgi:hypothetical protein